jgi:hypothetical protein
MDNEVEYHFSFYRRTNYSLLYCKLCIDLLLCVLFLLKNQAELMFVSLFDLNS